jgi:cytochrome c biogenesis protein CcmG, thiol:disulfide interchange protein DsbE
MNGWSKLLLLTATALVVTQLFVQRPRPVPRAAGSAAPALSLTALDGKKVNLASLRGRVVLVNFWATWCPPCRKELPDLAELWSEQQGRCFELLGVAEESPAPELAAAARRIPYPILLDPRGDAANDWSVTGYPKSYLIDPGGNVVRVFDGAIRKQQALEAMAPILPESCQGT